MLDLKMFRNIAYQVRTRCVVCDTVVADPLVDLPQFPLTEIYTGEKISGQIGGVDQKFHLCRTCGHGQLAHLIDKEILYGQCYRTRTSISSSAMGAVDVFAAFVDKILGERKVKTLLEVGCNDLYFLNLFKDKAEVLYGVDPILKDKEDQVADPRIKLIGDFFEHVDLRARGIKPDIVLSSHTFEHLERPSELMEKLIASSSDDALFFFQFPGLESLVNDARFDQMFHQHLNYFSVSSVIYLLEKLGAEPVDVQTNPYHWGALMVAFRKKPRPSSVGGCPRAACALIPDDLVRRQFQFFRNSMETAAHRMAQVSGDNLYGFGAAMMLPVLDYYIDGLRRLRFILDDDQSKENLYYLNFPVQIRTPRLVPDIRDAVIVLTAVYSLTTQRAILKRLIDLKVKQIILPINIL